MRTRALLIPLIAIVVALGADVATAERHSATARAASVVHVVKFGEYYYRPARLTIHAGDKVRFVNVGKIQHTVADSTKGGTIRSKIIHPRPLSHGQSQTVTFKRKGTVYYLCTFHPTRMRGVIVVR
jgi:plastocyanin